MCNDSPQDKPPSRRQPHASIVSMPVRTPITIDSISEEGERVGARISSNIILLIDGVPVRELILSDSMSGKEIFVTKQAEQVKTSRSDAASRPSHSQNDCLFEWTNQNARKRT
jgi:hypothetical protein